MKQSTKTIRVIPDDALSKLFKACSGTTFEDRRDKAVISCLLDTGVRLSELIVNVDDIDLDNWSIRVVGKGAEERVVPIGAKTRKDVVAMFALALITSWRSPLLCGSARAGR